MDIFLDELSIADQVQPKHMKFLTNLPMSTKNDFLDPKNNTASSFARMVNHGQTQFGNTSRTYGSNNPFKECAQQNLLHTGYNNNF